MLSDDTTAEPIDFWELRPGQIRRTGMPIMQEHHRRGAQIFLAAGLLLTSACGSEPFGASPGDGGTVGTEATETIVDPRRGAPLRADADPWPEKFDDVVPEVWYQLDWGINDCTSNIFWLPGQGPNDPGDLVFSEKIPTDWTEFIDKPVKSGVGRINSDGELEYTADGVDDVAIWEPRSASELGPFLCD